MATLLSAHRSGAGDDHALENSRLALERAVELEAEFVEFDVQRCRDGAFVLYHDDHVQRGGRAVAIADLSFDELRTVAPDCVRYDDALAILRGRKRAHIDLKFVSPGGADDARAEAAHEVVATQLAVEALGADGLIMTTLEDESVRAIRAWSRTRHPDLLVGLSLGRDMTGRPWREVLRTRRGELFPRRRITACDANLVVANKLLARLTLARFAKARGLPLLVWTVDDPHELRRWLTDHRPWLVTTNYPRRAAVLRSSLGRSPRLREYLAGARPRRSGLSRRRADG